MSTWVSPSACLDGVGGVTRKMQNSEQGRSGDLLSCVTNEPLVTWHNMIERATFGYDTTIKIKNRMSLFHHYKNKKQDEFVPIFAKRYK
jgi:hypothetical protein